jgi:hypothetical protein
MMATRQRVDYAKMGNGRVRATLTVTAPNGKVFRYSADSDAEDHALAGGYAIAGVQRRRRRTEIGAGWTIGPMRVTTDDVFSLRHYLRSGSHFLRDSSKEKQAAIESALYASQEVLDADDLAAAKAWTKITRSNRNWIHNKYGPPSGVEKLGKAALADVKKVVTSKVFRIAASALATAIPVVGPIVGPALYAASSALGVAGKLISAGVHAARGSKSVAQQLTSDAMADAKLLTSSPEAAQALVSIANGKRKAVETLAAPTKPATRPPVVTAPKKSDDVLAAARAGRLRSNRGGSITPAQLQAAADGGRIFWVA